MEGEASQLRARANWAVLITRAEGACGVLKNLHPAPAADVEEGVNVSRQAHLVNHHDRPGARVDASLGVGGVDVIGPRIHFGEDWSRSHVSDGVRGGDEAQRRNYHLIARPDAENEQRHVQRGSAATTSHRVLSPDILRDSALEFRHARPLSEPTAFNDLPDAFYFLGAHYGSGNWDHPQVTTSAATAAIFSLS